MVWEWFVRILTIKLSTERLLTFEPANHLLKRNKSHSYALKKIIKTNHVQLKSGISHQWFTKNVF